MRSGSRNLDRMAALLLLAILPAFVLGYTFYNPNDPDNGCVQCHGDFNPPGSDDLHGLHVNTMTSTCGLCHQTSIVDPVQIGDSDVGGASMSCNGCHMGVGLRVFHQGMTDNLGRACALCHGGDPAAPGENTRPPYYTRGDVNVKAACLSYEAIGGEDYDGDGEGLDNDGDGSYDKSDSDCASVPNIEHSWSSVKVQFDD